MRMPAIVPAPEDEAPNSHRECFVAPCDASQQPAIEAVQSFVQEVKEASPKTKVTVPNYFEAISLD
jgi:hypothetical protein